MLGKASAESSDRRIWTVLDDDMASQEDASAGLETVVLETTFPIGRLLATPGALSALERGGHTPTEFLARHVLRDWGELDEHDRRANHYAADHNERLLSAYSMADGTRLWIITEADRSATTMLLPEEY